MGFLDKLMDAAKGVMGNTVHHQTIMDEVVDMFKSEGIKGVMNRFNSKGFGDILSSWIGTGSNKSITHDQIKEVFGSERIQAIAKKAGISEDKVSQFLKDHIPGMVDKATPNGKIEE
jgi:uncharacterized protein YidB (DUF937 family)